MDTSTLPTELNIDVPLEGTGSDDIVYKLPKQLVVPVDAKLRVAVMSFSAPETPNVHGSEFVYQWRLDEEDINGNTHSTLFDEQRAYGFFADAVELWQYIMDCAQPVRIPRHEGGLNNRRKDIEICPSAFFKITETPTEIVIDHSHDAYKAFYVMRRTERLQFVLLCSDTMAEVLGSDELILSVEPHEVLTIPKENTNIEVVPFRHNICMKGLEEGMVGKRQSPLLLSRIMSEDRINNRISLYKELHPQRTDGSFSSWEELEIYFEDEIGNRLAHNEGQMHIKLSLQWTVSGRMRLEEPLLRDFSPFLEERDYGLTMKRPRLK